MNDRIAALTCACALVLTASEARAQNHEEDAGPARAVSAEAPDGGADTNAAEAKPAEKEPTAQSVQPPEKEPEKRLENEEKKETHWYDKLQIGLMADAYASFNYNRPTPQSPVVVQTSEASGGHGAPAYQNIRGGNQLRGYDITNGFALQWVGLDATYAVDPVSVVTSLRFGPGAYLLATQDDINAGIAFVRQAFVSWKALSALTVDLGKFDTPYGAEGLDNTGNPNYTRSHIFWFAQPGMHTGLRATLEASSSLSFQAMIVNGWDATIPKNGGKSIGLLAIWKPFEKAKVSAGYMGGPEGDDHNGLATDHPGAASRVRHYGDLFFDGMVTDKWRLLANVDYITERRPPSEGSIQAQWYGATLVNSYDFTEKLFGALRGSYFSDDQGAGTGTGTRVKVVEGTLTLGVRPAPGFLFMLDNRIDWTPDGAFFQVGEGGTSRTQVTSTLGFCATTAP